MRFYVLWEFSLYLKICFKVFKDNKASKFDVFLKKLSIATWSWSQASENLMLTTKPWTNFSCHVSPVWVSILSVLLASAMSKTALHWTTSPCMALRVSYKNLYHISKCTKCFWTCWTFSLTHRTSILFSVHMPYLQAWSLHWYFLCRVKMISSSPD